MSSTTIRLLTRPLRQHLYAPFANIPPRNAIFETLPPYIRFASSSARPQQPQVATHPLSYRDHSIPYSIVRLVSSHSGLLPPQNLTEILSTYSTLTHTLVLVSVDGPHPVVKLISRAEERAKEIEKEERGKIRRKLEITEKEVQVSWQSAQGDLEHKLELAKDLLQRGDRIQVVFANRKRAQPMGDQQKEEVVGMFDSVLAEYGKKWKADDKSGGIWILYYNPLDTVRQEMEKKVLDQEVLKKLEKEKTKEEKLEARRKKEDRRRQRAEEMEHQRNEVARRAEEEFQNRQKRSFGLWGSGRR
ncbi:uncharacterized protein L203_102217 [Cryptococcus depauperatus CBS 7841]|uniref:Uncharacterized protein n=1 Tax=Cryptococcus depauperatus CBS 7841 TaxID=1295531 RepID=A0A1E3IRN2_9TREE|nr:hypothetical protein L203_01472 [Cryptococcus depauperatus CBS 7841]